MKPAAPRRVEVWRDGEWKPSAFPSLAVGDVYRMFEPDGTPTVPPVFCVEAPAEETKMLKGCYRIKSKACPDPSQAVP